MLGLSDLYTDTDYKLLNFEFCEGRQSLQLYALNTSSTDFDLTGQVVWQAARIFCEWLFSSAETGQSLPPRVVGEQLFAGKRVLELGAGPGLGGFCVARWASQVLLSDY